MKRSYEEQVMKRGYEEQLRSYVVMKLWSYGVKELWGYGVMKGKTKIKEEAI